MQVGGLLHFGEQFVGGECSARPEAVLRADADEEDLPGGHV